MKLNFCPHLYSDTWPFVLVPVVLPQLRTKMNEVNHSCVASLSFSSSKSKFRLQHVLDILDIISNGSLMVILVEKLRETNIRGREGHLFYNLRVALPLLATGEILVGLDDGAPARPGIVVLALNSECDAPHKVFGRFYTFWRGVGMLHLVSITEGNGDVRVAALPRH